MYSNFKLHKNKRMFTNIATSVHLEPYGKEGEKEGERERERDCVACQCVIGISCSPKSQTVTRPLLINEPRGIQNPDL